MRGVGRKGGGGGFLCTLSRVLAGGKHSIPGQSSGSSAKVLTLQAVGHENEWLASQVRLLEGQTGSLDQEAHSHLLHSATPPPAGGLGGLQSDSSINIFGHVHQQPPGYGNLPQSAFEVSSLCHIPAMAAVLEMQINAILLLGI